MKKESSQTVNGSETALFRISAPDFVSLYLHAMLKLFSPPFEETPHNKSSGNERRLPPSPMLADDKHKHNSVMETGTILACNVVYYQKF